MLGEKRIDHPLMPPSALANLRTELATRAALAVLEGVREETLIREAIAWEICRQQEWINRAEIAVEERDSMDLGGGLTGKDKRTPIIISCRRRYVDELKGKLRLTTVD